MAIRQILPDDKFRWIARIYYNVASNPNHEVNIFTNVNDFLIGLVGDLRWGDDPQQREKAKNVFCDHMMRILDLYDYKINRSELLRCLQNEKMKNAEVTDQWARICEFPL